MSKSILLPSPQLRADSTRAKILKSARKLFVELGFEGVSLGKIASHANINHSLIFHHFGNKEGLWTAVKQSIVEESHQLSPTLPALNLSFREFLKKLMLQNINFYQNNPDIVRMINWQRVQAKNKKDKNKIGITLSTESKAWLAAFKYYQHKGDINTELKPEFILTLILSIISSAAMDPNVFIEKPSQLKNYINFCIDRILIALK